jgi:O-antigen/teichoic acid export membrane protein
MLMIVNRIKKLFPQFVKNYLANGNIRSIKVKKNIALSIIIKGFSILIGLVLVPLTINYLNPIKYGIWITLTSIIGWFGFFDIGLGNGLRNKFAEAVANGKHNLAKIYVSTTYAILTIIIVAFLVFYFSISPLLNWPKILSAPPEMAKELNLLAVIVFPLFTIQFILQLISTLLIANQQPARVSLLNLIGSAISLVIIYLLTKSTSGNLIYLGFIFNFVPVIVLIISNIWFFSKSYRIYAPSIKFVNFKYAKSLMGLGFKFFIIQIAAILLYQTNNIIISHLFGPEKVTPYNIAYKYFSILLMLFTIVITPFWSAYTEAWAKRDILWIKQTMKKIICIWKLLLVFGIIMLLVSKLVYLFWIGNKVTIPFSMSSLIMIWILLNIWNGIYSQFLNGLGKIKLQLYLGLSAAILNVPLAVFLGLKIGLEGVLLSNILVVGIVSWIYPIQYKKLITNSAYGIWNK